MLESAQQSFYLKSTLNYKVIKTILGFQVIFKKKVIEQAKKYAKKKNISLSKLIEAYLSRTSFQEKDEPVISPLVKSLSGILKLPKEFDRKKRR